jgi:hypothetical protein
MATRPTWLLVYLVARPGPQHRYRNAVAYLAETEELSTDERALVLGGSVRRIFGWPRA